MRITGGHHRSRLLERPPASITRPTKDRLRESLFNRLLNRKEPPFLPNAVVLDAFAGSGAFGLEALSHGASKAYFMENDAQALKALQANIISLGERTKSTLIIGDLLHCPDAVEPMDMIFLDPPYGKELVPKAISTLQEKRWIQRSTLIIAEVAAKERVQLPSSFYIQDERQYGQSKTVFITYNPT